MEMEKSKVSIQFLLVFRQSLDVLFFLCVHRFCGFTATEAYVDEVSNSKKRTSQPPKKLSVKEKNRFLIQLGNNFCPQ